MFKVQCSGVVVMTFRGVPLRLLHSATLYTNEYNISWAVLRWKKENQHVIVEISVEKYFLSEHRVERAHINSAGCRMRKLKTLKNRSDKKRVTIITSLFVIYALTYKFYKRFKFHTFLVKKTQTPSHFHGKKRGWARSAHTVGPHRYICRRPFEK